MEEERDIISIRMELRPGKSPQGKTGNPRWRSQIFPSSYYGGGRHG